METTASLRGRRVLVTRAADQAAGLRACLAAAGAEVVEVPLIEIEPLASGAEIGQAWERLLGHSGERWVVFTSANAVRVVVAGGLAGPQKLAGVRVAAVGERTAAVLAEWGPLPDLLPEARSSEGVGAAMTALGVNGARVWLPRGDLADASLPGVLRAAGADVDAQVVYRTVMPAGAPRALAAAGWLDAVTLTSDSTVANLITALAGRVLDPVTVVACLGPVTAAAAAAAGIRVDGIASDGGPTGLVAVLAGAFSARQEPGSGSRG